MCKECESTRRLLQEYTETVAALERQVDEFRLDYHSLYEKVRRNLARLAQRANSPPDEEKPNGPTDTMAEYYKLALARKLGGNRGL